MGDIGEERKHVELEPVEGVIVTELTDTDIAFVGMGGTITIGSDPQKLNTATT